MRTTKKYSSIDIKVEAAMFAPGTWCRPETLANAYVNYVRREQRRGREPRLSPRAFFKQYIND